MNFISDGSTDLVSVSVSGYLAMSADGADAYWMTDTENLYERIAELSISGGVSDEK